MFGPKQGQIGVPEWHTNFHYTGPITSCLAAGADQIDFSYLFATQDVLV